MNLCEICGIKTENKHFCSRKCAGFYRSNINNKLQPNKKIRKERILIKCGWDKCENIIEIIKEKSNKKRFCSNSCHIRWENNYNRLCEKGGYSY